MKKSKWINFIKDVGDIIGGILVGASIDKDNYILMGIGTVFITSSLYLEHFKKYENG